MAYRYITLKFRITDALGAVVQGSNVTTTTLDDDGNEFVQSNFSYDGYWYVNNNFQIFQNPFKPTETKDISINIKTSGYLDYNITKVYSYMVPAVNDAAILTSAPGGGVTTGTLTYNLTTIGIALAGKAVPTLGSTITWNSIYGTNTITLPTGTYTLTLTPPTGYTISSYSTSITITNGGNVDLGDITCTGYGTCIGYIYEVINNKNVVVSNTSYSFNGYTGTTDFNGMMTLTLPLVNVENWVLQVDGYNPVTYLHNTTIKVGYNGLNTFVVTRATDTDEIGITNAYTPMDYSLKDLWEYNTTTQTWTQKTSCSEPRQFGAAFSIGTYGYVTAGISRNGVKLDTWRYNTVSNAWSAAPTYIGLGRYNPVTFSTASYAYVGLGHTASHTHLQDLYKYIPSVSGWTGVATGVKGHFTAIGCPTGALVVGVAGDDDTAINVGSLSAYRFYESENIWESVALTSSEVNYINSTDIFKDGFFALNVASTNLVGLGLGNNYIVDVKQKYPYAYMRANWDVTYITDITQTPPEQVGGYYICNIFSCGGNLTAKSSSIYYCSKCGGYYTHNTTWHGGYPQNYKYSEIVDRKDNTTALPSGMDSNLVISYTRKFDVTEKI